MVGESSCDSDSSACMNFVHKEGSHVTALAGPQRALAHCRPSASKTQGLSQAPPGQGWMEQLIDEENWRTQTEDEDAVRARIPLTGPQHPIPLIISRDHEKMLA
jgi:hypothetical protein